MLYEWLEKHWSSFLDRTDEGVLENMNTRFEKCLAQLLQIT